MFLTLAKHDKTFYRNRFQEIITIKPKERKKATEMLFIVELSIFSIKVLVLNHINILRKSRSTTQI